MTRQELERILNALLLVRIGNGGICTQFHEKYRIVCPDATFNTLDKAENYLRTLTRKWPEYSGNPNYPVPSDIADLTAYMRFQQGSLWLGAYGISRMSLQDFLIASVNDHIQLQLNQ
jgi:hypothetical protein